VGNTLDRRQFLTHSAAASGVLAAGALAGQLAATPAGAVTEGGTLKVGVISEQRKPFSPDYANMDTSGFMYARAVFDPLCVVSADGATVYPYLAKSVTHNATYNEWTITPRSGIKFHDGTPCTGKSIYQNLLACYNSLLTGKAFKALISSISYVSHTDQVVVRTRYKWTTFPYSLASQQTGFIAAPSTLGAGYKGNPIGTGPFIYSNWNYNTSFRLDRNPKYWRSPLPHLDHIEFHPVPDEQTRWTELTDGVLDLIHTGDGGTIKRFPHGFNTWSDVAGRPAYAPGSNCVMLNVRKAPFNDLNFRRACAAAIDRTTFAKVSGSGESTAIDGIFLPGSPYYAKPPYPSFSTSAAKTYLSKSSVSKANRKFTLNCVSGSPGVIEAATLVQGFLKAVGISVTLNEVSQSVLIGDAIAGSFQATMWSQFGGASPDSNYPWFSAKSGLNFAGNSDPKIESAMVTALGATSTAARAKAWSLVNGQLARDLPYLWLDRAIWGFAAKSTVQNWKGFTDPAGHAVLQPDSGILFFTETWIS